MKSRDGGAAVGGSYILLYLLVIPMITSVISAFYKWYDDKGKFSVMFFILFGMTLLQLLGIVLCAFLFSSFADGIVVSFFMLAMLFVVA